MLNRKARNIALTAITIVSATVLAAVVPGGPPARASGISEYDLMANGGVPVGGLDYELHAHAHNYPLETVQSSLETNQDWDFINPEPWDLLNGSPLTAVQIQLANTGQCINWAATEGEFYLDSCSSGDPQEYFWMRPTGGTSTFGLAQYWFYSVGASQDGAAGTDYAYLTEDGLGEPADVVAEPPGWGLAAVWALGCQINC